VGDGSALVAGVRAQYCCFYPMDKKRGEVKNWYEVSIRDGKR